MTDICNYTDNYFQQLINEEKSVEVDLLDCLQQTSKLEELDDDNKWFCSHCKDHVKAKKQMNLMKTPEILIIHLKRFKSKGTYGFSKNNAFVKFPIKGLNMEPFVYCKKSMLEYHKEDPDKVIVQPYFLQPKQVEITNQQLQNL